MDFDSDADLQADDSKDEPRVPLSRLKKVLAQKEELERRLAEAGQNGGQQDAAKKPFTRSQLQAAVDNGQISDDDMANILANQDREAITADVTKNIKTEMTESRSTEDSQAEIDRYTDVDATLLEDGSQSRTRAGKEYQALVTRLGAPETKARKLQIEALALRMAFGDPKAFAAAHNEGQRETHEEIGGGRDERTVSKGAPKGLDARQRQFYERQIENGFYTGWDDEKLTSELEYVRPRRRA